MTCAKQQRAAMTDPETVGALEIVPADKASWEDIQTVFGSRGSAAFSRGRGVRAWCPRGRGLPDAHQAAGRSAGTRSMSAAGACSPRQTSPRSVGRRVALVVMRIDL
jgi:hypothetical protein